MQGMAMSLSVTTSGMMPTDLAGLSDEDLFRRFATTRGEDAFAELVGRHQQFAYHVAFSKSGNAEQAEEATQEAFMKLARASAANLSRFESFRKMFFGMVRNSARHRRRTQRRYQANIQSPRYREEALAMSTARNEAPDQGLNPHARELLERALGALEEDSRVPICMHFLQGMSQGDIAKLVGVNQSVISRRIKMGLESLRCHLAQAGMAFAVITLPELLKDPSLLTAPPQLKASLLKQGGAWMQACQGGAGDSLRAAAVTSFNKWIAGVVLVSLASAGGLWWRYHNPGVQGAQVDAPAETPVLGAEPAARTWDFNANAPLPAFLPVNASRWTWIANSGPDGSGCMETGVAWCSMALDVPVERLPVLVSFDYQNRPPADLDGWGLWLLWTRHQGLADFWNIAPLNEFDTANGPWMKARFFMTDKFVVMQSGKSMHLTVLERAPDAKLQLGMQGRQRIDNLRIEPVEQAAVPDVGKFLAALAEVPAAERTGQVELPKLECPVPGKKVIVKFFPPESK